MKKHCVFAGTFDPPTIGHKSVVSESLKIFDSITVAVLVNPQKECMFTEEERLKLLKKLFGGDDRVKVISFEGAAVDLLKKENTPFYVRGVRDGMDYEYENRNHYASKKLMPELVTVYIPAEQDEMFISSTLVRNSVKFKKDYTNYVPEEISADVKKLLEAKNV